MTKINWSLGPIATASFGLVFVALVFNSVVVHQNTMAFHAIQNSMNQSYDALVQTQTLFTLLEDSESYARGYVLTGNDSFLKNYRRVAFAIPNRVQLLRDSISRNPHQLNRVIELNQHVDDRLKHLEAITTHATAKELDAARELVLTQGENQDVDRIRKIIDEIKTDENRQLSLRIHEQDNRLFIVLAANLTAVIVGAAITIVAWHLVERELRMRRSAEAIAHSERQNLLVTLTSIDDGVIVADAKGRVKLVNPSAQQLIGNPQVVVGRRLSNIVSIVDEVTREPIENPMSRALARGKVSGNFGHPVLIRADGTEIPIEQSAAPIHDATGRITGVVFVFRDCSVQRKFEKEMRERARRFRRVFETPLIGVAVGTSQGDLLEANDAFLDLIGHPNEKRSDIPRSWDGIPFCQIPLDESAHLELRERGVCNPFEKTVTRADGTRVPVLISASRLTDDHDRVVVFVTDLSQSKRAEAALLESEARFRVLSECMPQMVWTARPDGHIDYLNPMLLGYCGIPSEQMQEWGWNSLIHPVDAQLQADAWKQSISSGNMFESELRFRNQQGEYRWHLARALPVYRPDGQIAMWVGTYTDIHSQKQAEEALREEHHRKDEFLALLAHELRNPLAPLSNAIHVFPSIRNDPKGSEELLSIMHRQVRQMTRLIDDLLDLARIATGRMRLRREKVAVGSAVAAAVEAVQPLICERQHRLRVSIPDEELWLDADSARLAQILTNLLHNAAKFTDLHGELALTVEHIGAEVLFRVSDNGPGISKNMLKKIFDLFTQVELTLDRAHGGLGIGLTLVRTLVELHGGAVTATSSGLGHGSEFVVRLPLMIVPVVHAGTTNSAECTPVAQPPLPVLRILVVDDVQASAKTLSLLLSTLGQKIEMAFDGPTAIARVAEADFDLIFLDIAMPGMDGLEVARRLRMNPKSSTVTLVALTGFGQDEDRAKSLKAGFNDHLTKPISLELLKQIIQRVSVNGIPAAVDENQQVGFRDDGTASADTLQQSRRCERSCPSVT